MSIFSTIKQNFTHGGVDIKLQAPGSASMQDASVPVTVTITAGNDPQTINKIIVEIIAESRSQSLNTTGSSTPSASANTVARTEYTVPFSLVANETKSIEIATTINSGAQLVDALPEGSAAAQVASVFQTLQTASQALSNTTYEYWVRAIADVEGITFDPSDKQRIQMLAPGEFGGSINARI